MPHAHPHLPRLPAARHRVQRLQRRARRGARARGPRGPPALPGPRPARARLGRRRRRLGRGAAGRHDAPRTRARDGLPAGHRRPAAGLRRRPLRRLRGAAVPGAAPTPSSTATSTPTWPPCARSSSASRPDVALANHLVMGPAILARALGGACPYAVKIHGSALEYMVKPHPRFRPVRARGPRGRQRRARRLAPHRARACGRRWPTRRCRERTRLGPPGVDVERVRARARADAAARAAASALAERLRPHAADRRGDRLLVRPRRRPRGRARARPSLEPRRPARGLRRQADRLQGRRPAARGVAAGARARAARRGCVSSASARSAPASRRCAARWPPATSTRARDDRAPRTGRELPRARRVPGRARGRRRLPRGGRRPGDRVAFAGRLDHAELADLLPAARGDGGHQHVPGGLRHGRRRGRGLRRAARSSRTTPGWRRSPRTLAAAVPEPARAWLSLRASAPTPSRELAGALVRLAGGRRRTLRARHPRGARRDHPRALLVGGRRAHACSPRPQGDLADAPAPPELDRIESPRRMTHGHRRSARRARRPPRQDPRRAARRWARR